MLFFLQRKISTNLLNIWRVKCIIVIILCTLYNVYAMKILEVQKSYNLQFTNKNPSKVKKAIVKGFLKNGNSSVNNENILSVSQEMKSRIEKQVRKAQREQLHYKFNRLQQEKDIKYKNLLG